MANVRRRDRRARARPVITVGVYALTGFEVTPATVIGFLTILGLLAVRHRRRVRQGAREHRRASPASTPTTYAEAANLAVNQTLVRSINTSIAALLPVGGDPVRRRVPARRRAAEGPGAGAVRRYGGRGLLVDLHRDAAAGAAQGARAGHAGAQAKRVSRARGARRGDSGGWCRPPEAAEERREARGTARPPAAAHRDHGAPGPTAAGASGAPAEARGRASKRGKR